MINILLKNSKIKFSKVPSNLRRYIRKKFFIPVKKWDNRARKNKVHKFSIFDYHRNLLPIGFIKNIIEFMEKNNIEYEINDSRSIPSTIETPNKINVELRGYQEKLVRMLTSNCFKYFTRDIIGNYETICSASGSGKTEILIEAIRRLGLKTIIFVHTKDLLYQFTNRIKKRLGLDTKVGILGDGRFTIGDINVFMIQTFAKLMSDCYGQYKKKSVSCQNCMYQFDCKLASFISRSKETDQKIDFVKRDIVKDFIQDVGICIVDECHHTPAKSFYKSVMEIDSWYKWGASATPWRDDGLTKLIEAGLGRTDVNIDASYLIRRDYLVPPLIKMIEIPRINTENAQLRDKNGNLNYHRVYKNVIVENTYRNAVICGLTSKILSLGRNVLILVKYIKHGEKLKRFIERMISIRRLETEVRFLQGDDSSEVRNSTYVNFREGYVKVLIATTLADEGLDLPNLNSLILAGGGKSTTRSLQRVMRPCRINNETNKQYALVYDFRDDNIFVSEHSKVRERIYNSEEEFLVEHSEPKEILEEDFMYNFNNNILGSFEEKSKINLI